MSTESARSLDVRLQGSGSMVWENINLPTVTNSEETRKNSSDLLRNREEDRSVC